MDAQSLGDAPSHPPDPTGWFSIVVEPSTVHLAAVGCGRSGREGMPNKSVADQRTRTVVRLLYVSGLMVLWLGVGSIGEG